MNDSFPSTVEEIIFTSSLIALAQTFKPNDAIESKEEIKEEESNLRKERGIVIACHQ